MSRASSMGVDVEEGCSPGGAWAHGRGVSGRISALGPVDLRGPSWLDVSFEQMCRMGKNFGPAWLCTFQEGLLKKKRFGLRPSLLVYAAGAGSFQLLLEIAIALLIAVSFSTLAFNEDWKSSPKRVLLADGSCHH